MVQEQLRSRGIRDERVLNAFLRVPRHAFVPPDLLQDAYSDHPLPIGEGQTISQPYIVALMTEALRLHGTEVVLEVGTGSGYQAAILSELALDIYTIERVPSLADAAQTALGQLGITNVHVAVGDGTLGWPEHAPYDGILVAAAASAVPPPLLKQLGAQARLVMPVGGPGAQVLQVVMQDGEQRTVTELSGCVFVPLLGAYGEPPLHD